MIRFFREQNAGTKAFCKTKKSRFMAHAVLLKAAPHDPIKSHLMDHAALPQ